MASIDNFIQTSDALDMIEEANELTEIFTGIYDQTSAFELLELVTDGKGTAYLLRQGHRRGTLSVTEIDWEGKADPVSYFLYADRGAAIRATFELLESYRDHPEAIAEALGELDPAE